MLTITTAAMMSLALPRKTRVEMKPRQLRTFAANPSLVPPSPRTEYPDLRNMAFCSRGEGWQTVDA